MKLSMNVPAILNLFKVIRDPSLCLPHATVANFTNLPIPLSLAFTPNRHDGAKVEIKAVVLDKDNCFAVPKENTIHAPYTEKFSELVKAYSPENILIVSNSSGLEISDPKGEEADLLERNTGIKVLRHTVRKPDCAAEILSYFGKRISSPSQIAVIGDRLFTDVVMANTMGAHSIWVREGAIPDRGLVTRFEYGLSTYLLSRGLKAPIR